jgi:hypothetical protein
VATASCPITILPIRSSTLDQEAARIETTGPNSSPTTWQSKGGDCDPEASNLYNRSSKKSLNDVVGEELCFWNTGGESYMGLGAFNGAFYADLQSTFNEKAKFHIVRVDIAKAVGTASSAGTPNTVNVAIQTTDGSKKFLSCGHKMPSNSALASFGSKPTPGESETFSMSYCARDNRFFFQSHNHLFLHYNETFHSVAFKACSEIHEKDGFPKKGRWELLLEGENTRAGKKDGNMMLAYQGSVGWTVSILRWRPSKHAPS